MNISRVKNILNNMAMYVKYGVMRKTYRKIYIAKNKKDVAYIPVLAFHWFLSDEEKHTDKFKENKWYASVKNFENQLKWLKDHNYYSITCDIFYEWIQGKTELKGKPVLLTFDDGEMSQLKMVVPLLNKYKLNGICFVVGKHFVCDDKASVPLKASEDSVTYFSEKQYDENKEANSVMELESHTYNLHYSIDAKAAACLISDEELRNDIKLMRQLGFDYIAMPYGAYGANTESIISENYKMGFAIDVFGNPYANRNSRLYAVNRILVDGKADADYLERYLY